MKKLLGVLALFCLLISCGIRAGAADTKDTVIALGADLSDEQRAAVLSLMGLTEEDLAGCTVIYITNEMEHEYLDPYLEASVIGSKSLSSVKITGKEPGSGVTVTTQNVNYCTTGMYRNALMTAGMEDTEVLVVARIQNIVRYFLIRHHLIGFQSSDQSCRSRYRCRCRSAFINGTYGRRSGRLHGNLYYK